MSREWNAMAPPSLRRPCSYPSKSFSLSHGVSAVYLWTANSEGSLRLRWPAAYRSLQMGAWELQRCVHVKAAGRESRHIRIAKVLCEKVTAIGLHSEGQPKGCNSNKGHRQGIWLKKDGNRIFRWGRDVGLVALVISATCWARNSENLEKNPSNQDNC